MKPYDKLQKNLSSELTQKTKIRILVWRRSSQYRFYSILYYNIEAFLFFLEQRHSHKESNALGRTKYKILHVKKVIFQLFNILLKKELVLKQNKAMIGVLFIMHPNKVIFQLLNISLKEDSLILHVIGIIFQLLNILLRKELILNLKIFSKELLSILHVKMIFFKLFNC